MLHARLIAGSCPSLKLSKLSASRVACRACSAIWTNSTNQAAAAPLRDLQHRQACTAQPQPRSMLPCRLPRLTHVHYPAGSAPQVGMMGQKQDATEGNLPAPLSPKWVGRRSRSPASRIGRVPGASGGSDKSASREQQRAGGGVRQALQSSSSSTSRQAAAAESAPSRALGALAADHTGAAPSGSSSQPKVPSRLGRCHTTGAARHHSPPPNQAPASFLAGCQGDTGTPAGPSQQQATSSPSPEAGQPAEQEAPSGLEGHAASPRAGVCRQQEEPSRRQEVPLRTPQGHSPRQHLPGQSCQECGTSVSPCPACGGPSRAHAAWHQSCLQ